MTKLQNNHHINIDRSIEIMQAYLDRFGKEPYEIGMFWSDRERFNQNLLDAIKSGVPYNEYELLDDDNKKAFDEGNLLF